MKIGLVRHFKVKKRKPSKWLITSDELIDWFDEYNTAEVEIGETDLMDVGWQSCYSSDLSRAVTTAKHIFSDDLEMTDKLREVKAYPLFSRRLKLPFIFWITAVRLAWICRHPSQRETKEVVKARIREAVDDILSRGEENILIVSHGGTMIYLQKELSKRGFIGPKIRMPANGKLYLFEKQKGEEYVGTNESKRDEATI